MAIPETYRRNFDTLLRAAADGNLALMECTDAVSRVPRYVLCAVDPDGDDYVMTPFGHLHGNPFEAHRPPDSDTPTSGTKLD
jgi:hypothetical protein